LGRSTGCYLANAGLLLKYLFITQYSRISPSTTLERRPCRLGRSSLNASLWTLKIEFAFYLLVPFLWRLTARYGDKLLITIFVLSAIYFEILLRTGHYSGPSQLPGQMQYFVLGIGL